MFKARTGVPELGGRALVCLSAIKTKFGLLFCIAYDCIGLTHGSES